MRPLANLLGPFAYHLYISMDSYFCTTVVYKPVAKSIPALTVGGTSSCYPSVRPYVCPMSLAPALRPQLKYGDRARAMRQNSAVNLFGDFNRGVACLKPSEISN